jgi:hypothetical protein
MSRGSYIDVILPRFVHMLGISTGGANGGEAEGRAATAGVA